MAKVVSLCVYNPYYGVVSFSRKFCLTHARQHHPTIFIHYKFSFKTLTCRLELNCSLYIRIHTYNHTYLSFFLWVQQQQRRIINLCMLHNRITIQSSHLCAAVSYVVYMHMQAGSQAGRQACIEETTIHHHFNKFAVHRAPPWLIFNSLKKSAIIDDEIACTITHACIHIT